MKLKNKFMLDTSVQLAKIISSQVAKVKIYVLYEGKNRNNTYFSRQMIEEKLIPSMYGMPIIGEFLVEKGDFGGHGGKVVITEENGAEFIQTTVALGFVPESAKMEWETVTELNGLTREYLTTEGYVWYKRFPEVECILEEPRNQSMEIDILDAEYRADINAYDILDANLTGLCILGKSVEPCFESARIGRFELERFKYDLSEMSRELKEIMKSEVSQMDKFENVETTEVTEEVVVEETTETTEVVTEEETTEETTETVEEVAETEEVEEETAETTEVEEVEETTEEYSVEETTEEPVEEVVEITEIETVEETTEVEEVTESVDFEKQVAEYEVKIQALEQELVELREFKATKELEEKESLLNSFANELDAEEIESVRETIATVDKDTLETQLFALVGKKRLNSTFSHQKPSTTKTVVAIADNYSEIDPSIPAWARSIEKYSKH